ncbi:hypothetical protein FGO68_gene8922 [Halteria grandinella]|uniref:Uncharacterized protein n=1 Tax=Halteria grandinella TaxID=5974 RepID=A0A8J8T5V3_HALGN|nr:hypothetical protein FGO68_gene8922 [Halteria grandinella]
MNEDLLVNPKQSPVKETQKGKVVFDPNVELDAYPDEDNLEVSPGREALIAEFQDAKEFTQKTAKPLEEQEVKEPQRPSLQAKFNVFPKLSIRRKRGRLRKRWTQRRQRRTRSQRPNSIGYGMSAATILTRSTPWIRVMERFKLQRMMAGVALRQSSIVISFADIRQIRLSNAISASSTGRLRASCAKDTIKFMLHL